MKKTIYIFSILSFFALATPVLAQTGKITNFKDLVNNVFISGILRPIVPLLIGLAVVVFIYGVLVLMFAEGGEKKEDGKKFMLWGIIGIFVMVSVWGLVAILVETFNLKTDTPTINISIPTVR